MQKMLVARRRARRSGFTLMEMLIVLGIIGLLMGILVVGFGNITSGAEEQTAGIFVNQTIKAPLQAYRMHMGGYPSTEAGLGALLNSPGGARASRWKGPYVDKLPEDPWGNPYQYRYPGQRNPRGYDVWSNGPDGRPSEDDIGNW